MYSVKPLDTSTVIAAVRETGRLVIVADHHPEGGIASAVLGTLAHSRHLDVDVTSLAIRELPAPVPVTS